MNQSQADPELNLGPLVALINAEVQATLDEIEQQSPANLRITSVRVAMGQDDESGTPSGEGPVLRKADYSLSGQGWMIELAFGGGAGSVRKRGGDWMPLPRPGPVSDRSGDHDDEDGNGGPPAEWWTPWKILLHRWQFAFALARRFFRRVARLGRQ